MDQVAAVDKGVVGIGFHDDQVRVRGDLADGESGADGAFAPGTFGENLTTVGLDLAALKINQRVRAGILEFAWLTDDVRVELIGDGRHVPCEVLRLALKIKGADKINLTSDAMRAAGTDAKESYLGAIRPENRVIVEDGVAKLPDRSFYAGSIATADRMLAWAVNECGVPLHEAVRMLSLSPAKVVGLDGQKGSLDNGKDADFLLADEQLRVEQVFLRGERMF